MRHQTKIKKDQATHGIAQITQVTVASVVWQQLAAENRRWNERFTRRCESSLGAGVWSLRNGVSLRVHPLSAVPRVETRTREGGAAFHPHQFPVVLLKPVWKEEHPRSPPDGVEVLSCECVECAREAVLVLMFKKPRWIQIEMFIRWKIKKRILITL